MSSNTVHTEKADVSTDDHQRADHASDTFMVGIDIDGREHYYSRIRGAMTVLDDGEHETQSLNGRPLKHWMAFVEEELGGWDETNVYSGSTFEHLCDQLNAAVNAKDNQ